MEQIYLREKISADEVIYFSINFLSVMKSCFLVLGIFNRLSLTLKVVCDELNDPAKQKRPRRN